MTAFEDVKEEFENAKKCFEYVYSKDIPESAEAMTDWCSFNIDWFPEPMPLENQEGTALLKEVRSMIGEACYKDELPELPKQEPAPQEDILVFTDQQGFMQRVLDKAPEGRVGSKKFVGKPPALLSVEDFESLLGQKSWDMIVFAGTLDAPKSNSVADVIDQQSACAKAVFLLLQTMYKKEGCCKRFAVLTNDIFSESEETNKERGLGMTTNGTMFGMMNTARLELEIPIQLVDVEETDCQELVPHVAAELFRKDTFGVNTVRHCFPSPIRHGIRTNRPVGRHVVRQLTTRKYQKADVKFEIPEQGTIAISGGNGALGLVMGLWLLDTVEKEKKASGGTYAPRFTIEFLSRSAKVSGQNEGNWEKIQSKAKSLGIEVTQGKMDMSSQAAVDSYISKVTPNLIGFIHSAGILQDSMLPNQSWEKFEAVYSGKHWAALYLHDALERMSNPNLKFFWMFSSTSVYGNMGQINYSSSNSYMDALARHRRALGKPALAIQWGAWGEVGMAATMDDAMRRRVMMGPMPYFTVKQGLEGLEGGLRTGLPGFSVFIVNPPVYFGMIQGDQSTNACYSRNFSSEWCPTPCPQTVSDDAAYNLYRMCRYVTTPYTSTTSIVWDKYIQPKLEKMEEEDDGAIEYGYGLA